MLKLIFADDFLMVFDKPPGLVVTSTQTQQEPTLEDILRMQYGIKAERAGIVHRLDKETSGLLVVAKRPEVQQTLQAQFQRRTVYKEYLALVHGWIKEAGKVEAPIARNPVDREKFMVVQLMPQSKIDLEKIRAAITEYTPLKLLFMSDERVKEIFTDYSKIQLRKLFTSHYQHFTLLSCHPLTGRTHQIRVHLKYIGYPIVGDEKYGGRKISRLDRRWCPRQFLHATRLEFDHPQIGQRMIFTSPLPEDLKRVLLNLQEVNDSYSD